MKNIFLFIIVTILFNCKPEKEEPLPTTLPVVLTGEISEITATTAQADGQVVSEGNLSVIERGVVLGLNSEPTLADIKVSQGAGLGSFIAQLTELNPASKYYYRSYAINGKGTAYGMNKTFSTDPTLALVVTLEVTELSAYGISAGGNVTDTGGAEILMRGICWSPSPGPTISDNVVESGTGGGNFTSSITGLSPSSKYYIRAYATNSAGTAYGNEVIVTTLSLPVPLDGLIGWWPFNGNANDEGGNGNNGVVNGAVLTNDRFGLSNSAYLFNGNEVNSITGNCSNFPSGNSARTISVWYSAEGLNTIYGMQLLGYGGNSCGESFIMNFENYDAGFGNYEVQGHCLAFRQFTNYPTPANSTWHMITLTYDGTVFRFYNNGVLNYTSPVVTLSTYVSNRIFCFGREVFTDGLSPYIDPGWRGFTGKLDDIAIYNRALTAEEIQKIYNGTGF